LYGVRNGTAEVVATKYEKLAGEAGRLENYGMIAVGRPEFSGFEPAPAL
jgi:hypothetical protein